MVSVQIYFIEGRSEAVVTYEFILPGAIYGEQLPLWIPLPPDEGLAFSREIFRRLESLGDLLGADTEFLLHPKAVAYTSLKEWGDPSTPKKIFAAIARIPKLLGYEEEEI